MNTKHKVSMSDKLTLQEYLDKKMDFVIPYYQRGYVWGKGSDSDNAVNYMLKTIETNYSNEKKDIFLQGITASENEADKTITLIDGQQRTTFFYLLLCYLERSENMNINYEIRKESKQFLKGIKGKSQTEIIASIREDKNEPHQDIFFFKKTLRAIHSKFSAYIKEELSTYLLNNINFLYINISAEKAIRTFTMMNGQKANIQDEELIKAELLRQVSLPVGGKTADFEDSWEINTLRSKYAKEWDRWLHWWKRSEVSTLFQTKRQLGWLLICFAKHKNKLSSNFESFQDLLKDSRSTKLHFKTLRKLQKSFENIFNNAITYNWLGVSLVKTNFDEQYKIINYFLTHKHNEALLGDFAKWRVIGATYDEIVKGTSTNKEIEDAKKLKAMEALEAISHEFVYNGDGDSIARRYLLYLNVLEDNKTNNNKGRKFNFSIFNNQSLEHIHPKSRVYHLEDDCYFDGNDCEIEKPEAQHKEWLDRDALPEGISEHSIGNLVLLEGKNNSAFGNSTFEEKKRKYFDLNTSFESRELLHTIAAFANNKWGVEEITKNQEEVLSNFKQTYLINQHNTATDED